MVDPSDDALEGAWMLDPREARLEGASGCAFQGRGKWRLMMPWARGKMLFALLDIATPQAHRAIKTRIMACPISSLYMQSTNNKHSQTLRYARPVSQLIGHVNVLHDRLDDIAVVYH